MPIASQQDGAMESTMAGDGGTRSNPRLNFEREFNQANYRSMVEVVREHSTKVDASAFIFLKDGETEESTLTFSMLDAQARAMAALLQNRLNEGDRVLLLFPSGQHFIVALLGCMYAGMIAVPVSLPRRQQGLEKLCAIASNCAAKLILTDELSLHGLMPRLNESPQMQAIPIVAVDAPRAENVAQLAEGWRPPSQHRSSIAFLQYTSGSTGTPKGIAITHDNLLTNQQMIKDAFAHGPETVHVNWLPVHHDMGLVGNVLQSVYLGTPCVVMSPMAFMQRPARWLQAISKYQATTSGGPNFAYELCVRAITPEQMADLDLRSWRLAFNGAEPVRAETLERFSEKFRAAGFSRKAFFPCYGMAETTVFVTGGPAGQDFRVRDVSADAMEKNTVISAGPTESKLTLVGCGVSWGDQQMLIVDPDTKLHCNDGAVGEIWVKGSHVARGYWNLHEATEEHFKACLADSGEGPFLRTGDLGFIEDGQLFVTGRRKELIIIKGRNLYPHDIEDVIAVSHEALEGCNGAAFSLDINGEEKLVVVHEIARRHLDTACAREILLCAREAVVRNFDVQLHDLVLLKPKTIPRTTSGKIQRNLCRTLYRQGALSVADVV